MVYHSEYNLFIFEIYSYGRDRNLRLEMSLRLTLAELDLNYDSFLQDIEVTNEFYR